MIGVDFWVGRGKQDLGYSLGSRSCVVSEVRRVEVWSGSGSLVRGVWSGGVLGIWPPGLVLSVTLFLGNGACNTNSKNMLDFAKSSN
jgi:hypothetical protein